MSEHHSHHHSHGSHSSHGSHHSHHRKQRKWILPTVFGILVIAAVITVVGYLSIERQNSMNISAANPMNVKAGYREVTYKGKLYRYNNRIRTILFAGLDSEGEMVTYRAYTGAPRADSISMVVMDEYHGKMTIISLNRDTMTEIHRYTLDGKDRGLFKDHLCLSFTYGNGGVVSCSNLCTAVSNLFYSIPVTDYMIINRSAIPALSEIIGPVTVTVPNNDLVDQGFIMGEQVEITTDNIETFVRRRDIEVDFSANYRMERQKAYINAAANQVQQLLTGNASSVWDMIQQSESYLLTNITRSQYLDLIRILKNVSYSEADYYIPEGDAVTTQRYDEFHVDEEALMEKIIELFYLEV